MRAPLERFLEGACKVAFQSRIEYGKAAEVRDEAALVIERKTQSRAFFHNDSLHPPGPTKRQRGKKDGHLQAVTESPSKHRHWPLHLDAVTPVPKRDGVR